MKFENIKIRHWFKIRDKRLLDHIGDLCQRIPNHTSANTYNFEKGEVMHLRRDTKVEPSYGPIECRPFAGRHIIVRPDKTWDDAT